MWLRIQTMFVLSFMKWTLSVWGTAVLSENPRQRRAIGYQVAEWKKKANNKQGKEGVLEQETVAIYC
jgi:hypothetical protein